MRGRPHEVGAVLLAGWFGLWAAPAHAQAPEPCGPGHWSLEGAASLPGEAQEASSSPAWLPVLDQVASCLRADAARYACVHVEGRFDEVTFSRPVIAAFGSLEAAQLARAQGRAGWVMRQLESLGVPSQQLREVRPAPIPTFRGAELTLVPECLPRPAQLSAEERAALDRAVALSRQPAAAPQAAPAPGFWATSRFWADLGLHGQLALVRPQSVVGSAARAGLGWSRGLGWVRLSLGAGLAQRAEQRTAAELVAAGGVQFLPWLQGGVQLGHRWGAPGPSRPWLERSWFAGLEATECSLSLYRGLQLCLQQAVLPFGSQVQRAELNDGNIERIPPQSHGAVRFDLALLVRRAL